MTVHVMPLVSPDEIDSVMAIEHASFTNPWTREMYDAELANSSVSRFLLARDEQGLIVGFCAFWHVVDEIHVHNLAVTPARRRTGIGSALVSALISEAERHHARQLFLEVRRSNAPAQALYQRFGFTVVHTRPEYYSHPVEDALVLSRTLSSPAKLES
jgi:[ribosomal protein S18]-alanine N-acetyltransferase